MPSITMTGTDPVDLDALARYQAEAAAIRHAQLADMPVAEIAAYLRERGYRVERVPPELPTMTLRCDTLKRVYWDDRLPAGYPPLADDDLPFDGSDRRE